MGHFLPTLPATFFDGAMQSECRTTLGRRMAEQKDERGRHLFHYAGKTEPGGKRNLTHQPFLDISQINSNQAEPTILYDDVRRLECLFYRPHGFSALASHP